MELISPLLNIDGAGGRETIVDTLRSIDTRLSELSTSIDKRLTVISADIREMKIDIKQLARDWKTIFPEESRAQRRGFSDSVSRAIAKGKTGR